MVLALELPASSTVSDLEERMVTALGDSWKNASFWLGEHQAGHVVIIEVHQSTSESLVTNNIK